jgi:hypothetical protein
VARGGTRAGEARRDQPDSVPVVIGSTVQNVGKGEQAGA